MSKNDLTIARAQRSRAQTQAAYDRLSRWYDPLAADWEKQPREFALRLLCPKPGERILEIGCGTGQSLAPIARAIGGTGRVYGIELSPRMIEISKARVSRAGLAQCAELMCGDATLLPFGDNSFDAIFMSFVLELFDTPEIPAVVCECRRVLKPKGRIGAIALSKAGVGNWMRDVYEWGHAHFPGLLDCRPIFLERALKDGGLQIRQATLLSLWGLPTEVVIARKE